MAGFNQFNQYAGCTGWVQENVAMATSADLDFVRDQACAAGFQFLYGCVQVGHANGNVVQTFTTLGNKFCNHGIVGSGFEKFQPGFADWNHHHPNIFVRHNFFGGKRQPKFLVNALCICERPYGDAEMVKGERHVELQ